MNTQNTHPNRAELFDRLSEDEIVRRYRKNYDLGSDIGMTHVQRHVVLEADLTDQLLDSTATNRWTIFSDAYSTLYRELPWLAGTGSSSGAKAWMYLMTPRSKVFEVGSGSGALINFLSDHEFDCYATEITSERGEKIGAKSTGISWRRTDGVHLDQFELPDSFDYVISDQVVEHLHPDDAIAHFQAARRILRPGGAYIVRTPHKSSGPHDLSRVFDMDESVFMHLHEFTFQEIEKMATVCGYGEVRAVLTIPWLSRRINWYYSSRLYQRYMVFLERVESAVTKTSEGRRRFRRLGWRFLLSAPSVWIVLRR